MVELLPHFLEENIEAQRCWAVTPTQPAPQKPGCGVSPGPLGIRGHVTTRPHDASAVGWEGAGVQVEDSPWVGP